MKARSWIIKLISFISTFALLFILAGYFGVVHYNFIFLISAFVVCLLLGELIIFSELSSKPLLINIAWGLVYGSLTVFILIVGLIIYVSYCYGQ